MPKLSLRASALKLSSLTVGVALLSACQYTQVPKGEAEKHYDFDHKVHYEQITYSDTYFKLAIKPDSYAHFRQQSVFLLRHAKRLCQGAHPQVTLLSGVQDFDRLPLEPRPYQNDLTVEIKCVAR
ncbi:hypothetical protein [Pseudoalteromonas sp. PS5]|uniref:hypothetical protein n=1 Tax=Pseudoalteromonas sp. PS5 TaxID=1437473 RepID=UPI000FFEFDAA|nr:hypothetical protein [Pseudoalteromonas sp. PS5]RXF06620.1 hypothetical protein D9603_01585 [Pseudoalteromonas sp. PS5]